MSRCSQLCQVAICRAGTDARPAAHVGICAPGGDGSIRNVTPLGFEVQEQLLLCVTAEGNDKSIWYGALRGTSSRGYLARGLSALLAIVLPIYGMPCRFRNAAMSRHRALCKPIMIPLWILLERCLAALISYSVVLLSTTLYSYDCRISCIIWYQRSSNSPAAPSAGVSGVGGDGSYCGS